jgi:molecular chaperone GrpE
VSKHHHSQHVPVQPQAAEAKPQADGAKPQGADVIPPVECPPGGDDVLQKLRAELVAAKERELRCHAELDNYLKRAARELEERLRYANLGLLRDLMPVIDNVGRAIQAAEQKADAAALLEGFKMVEQQLDDVLRRHHCTRIEALHAPFDPNVHHAIMQQPSEEYPANTVLLVAQNGYQLHDRVVRPSQVIVSTAKQAAPPN